MAEKKSAKQEILENAAYRVEQLDRLQNMKEFESLKWYFNMIAEYAIRELVAKKDLSIQEQERLKAKIDICKFEFENIGTWIKNEDEAARQLYEEMHNEGELKNLT
jgi:hypothetical protein|tara:strand:+ start:10335 stop:10652 length:318 start_codon:yes stop_codon:yes gene_type:complete